MLLAVDVPSFIYATIKSIHEKKREYQENASLNFFILIHIK
jgi:hypothetical protein